jgi:hypothetical protein
MNSTDESGGGLQIKKEPSDHHLGRIDTWPHKLKEESLGLKKNLREQPFGNRAR